jgi:hypothetical protein
MTANAVGQRLAPPPTVRSVSTPSLTTSPAIGTSAGSRSQGGWSHRTAGGRTPAAPPTFSEGRLGRARISATRRRPSCEAPHEGGPSAGLLGRGEPPDASSSPRSCRAWPPATGATMTLQRREEATTRTTPTCCSSRPGAGDISAPRRLGRRVFIGGDTKLPAFHLLMRLSLRLHLAIWHFLCCALRAARLFSVAASF